MIIEARQIPWESCPFWERHVTLGRLKDGKLSYVQNKGDKDEMLKTANADMEAGASFFIAWTGRWRTDIFEVTKKDIVEMIVSR